MTNKDCRAMKGSGTESCALVVYVPKRKGWSGICDPTRSIVVMCFCVLLVASICGYVVVFTDGNSVDENGQDVAIGGQNMNNSGNMTIQSRKETVGIGNETANMKSYINSTRIDNCTAVSFTDDLSNISISYDVIQLGTSFDLLLRGLNSQFENRIHDIISVYQKSVTESEDTSNCIKIKTEEILKDYEASIARNNDEYDRAKHDIINKEIDANSHRIDQISAITSMDIWNRAKEYSTDSLNMQDSIDQKQNDQAQNLDNIRRRYRESVDLLKHELQVALQRKNKKNLESEEDKESRLNLAATQCNPCLNSMLNKAQQALTNLTSCLVSKYDAGNANHDTTAISSSDYDSCLKINGLSKFAANYP